MANKVTQKQVVKQGTTIKIGQDKITLEQDALIEDVLAELREEFGDITLDDIDYDGSNIVVDNKRPETNGLK